MMQFDQMVNGVPLLLVVMGLVEWSKGLGVQGKYLFILSMALGLVFGIGYQLSLAIPTTFAGWFGAAVFGLALGLMASKVYDSVKSATKAMPE